MSFPITHGVSSNFNSYAAIFTQSLTDEPNVNVVANEIGPIVWTRQGIGVYNGTLVSGFKIGKTTIDAVLGISSLQLPHITAYIVETESPFADSVEIVVRNITTGQLVDLGGVLYIEIRNYP